MTWAAVAAAVVGAGASIYSSNKAAKAASQPSTVTGEPWLPMQGYLTGNTWLGPLAYPSGNTGLYPSAEAAFRQTQGGYPGPYISPQSPYSIQAIQGLADQARDPNSPNARAINQLGATISGDYLDVTKNPYLSGAVEQALKQVRGQTSSAFSNENYGGSANQQWLGQNLADRALPIYANAYQQERQNQLNALSLSPSLQQANLQQLAGAGAAQEARGQQEIQAAQQQFYAPWTPLQSYAQILSSQQVPFSTSTMTPYGYSALNAGLGGALAGYQLAQQFGGFGQAGSPQMSYFPSSGGDVSGIYDPGYGYGGY